MAIHLLCEIHWRPGIGDPSLVGWVTAGIYLGTAFLCMRAARRGAVFPDTGLRRKAALVWYLLAAGVLALGINKQLDLQTLLTECGREMAKAEGWYGARREVQAAFILFLVVVGCAAVLAFALFTAPVLRQASLAFAGLVLLLVFVLVRAASFHHIDQWLGRLPRGLRLIWMLELLGTACIALSAWRFVRKQGALDREAQGHGRDGDDQGCNASEVQTGDVRDP